jgi:hypothetical protein
MQDYFLANSIIEQNWGKLRRSSVTLSYARAVLTRKKKCHSHLRRYSIFSEYLKLLLAEEQEDEIIYV